MSPDTVLDELTAEILTPEQFEDLLEALAGDNPVGDDLRYEGTYDRIAEARREDDVSLPQGDWKTALKKADWKEAERICLDTLRHRSKDLQVAAWLTEAWIRRHGFSGLYLGCRLLLELCRRYWDKVYPSLAPDDVELRLSPFIWINERFFLPLTQVPITAPQTRDVAAYNFLEREEAWRLVPGSPEEKAADAEGKATRGKFANSVNMTPSVFFQRRWIALQACKDVIEELTGVLDAHCGKQAPSFGKLLKQLDAIAHVIKSALPEADETGTETGTEAAAMPDEETDTPASEAEPGETEPAIFGGGSIRSRREAYQRLAEAAEYLLRTEPHSPVPYLVKRAVSWGNLSLQELLLELVNDKQDLATIYQLLDIGQGQQKD